MAAPDSVVVGAIEAGTTSITRRAEFYESDGVTPWYPDDLDESRLIDGSVSVDYGRDERRSVDLTLDNVDNALRPDPNGGLWYDKIIKCFRGVTYPADPQSPKIAIVEAPDTTTAWYIRNILVRLGYTRTDVLTSATTYTDVADYSILVSFMGGGKTAKTAFLQTAYDQGKKIITQGSTNDATSVPLLIATGASASSAPGIDPVDYDTPLNGGWYTEAYATSTHYVPATAVAGAIIVATRTNATTQPYAIIRSNAADGRWFHYQPPDFGTQGKLLLSNALTWLRNYKSYLSWETQVGEFLIDNISEDHWPYQTKITGRDYTKRCLNSKLEQTLTFDQSTPLNVFVQAIAANAGIVKFNLPVTAETIGSGMTFDRTTERWALIKKACDANNYEVFFDAFGYLTMRPYYDPVTSPLAQTFQTGADGNLVSWTRSTNDSRLYNHIIVTGDSGEEGVLPFFGEARNDEPSSPTRIQRIGDRSYFYTSSFFTSDQQCQDLALRWLKEKALESYELSWSSINYPWLEVGEIVEFLDPRRLDFEPTRFLMDSLSIPMGLGPMSGTGKRVTYVNDPSIVPVTVSA